MSLPMGGLLAPLVDAAADRRRHVHANDGRGQRLRQPDPVVPDDHRPDGAGDLDATAGLVVSMLLAMLGAGDLTPLAKVVCQEKWCANGIEHA